MNVSRSQPIVSRGIDWLKEKLQKPEVKKALGEVFADIGEDVSLSELSSLGLDAKSSKLDTSSLLKQLSETIPNPTLAEQIGQWAGRLASQEQQSSDSLAAQIKSQIDQLGILEPDFGLTSTPPPSKQERFSGSWQDYSDAIKAHNKSISDAYAADGTQDEKMARAMAIPPLSAPPSLSTQQALNTWNFRFPESGRLLSAPGSALSPKLTNLKGSLEDTLTRLSSHLEQEPKQLELHLYSGNTPPFTSVTKNKWTGKGQVDENKALMHATYTTLYPEQELLTEINIPVGSLDGVKTEGELAFVMARQLAQALHIGPTKSTDTAESNLIFMRAPANTIKADSFAFKLLADAGYDPTEGLNFLSRDLAASHPKSNKDSEVATRAFSSAQPDQGPRLAAAQAVVESLRRSKPEAKPGPPSPPLSSDFEVPEIANEDREMIRLELNSRIGKLVKEHAQEIVALDPSARAVDSIEKESTLYKGLERFKGHFDDLGSIFADNLSVIDNSKLDNQDKIDTALFLLMGLNKAARKISNDPKVWAQTGKRISPFELPQETFNKFLAKNSKDGAWSSELFLKKFDGLDDPARSKRNFAKQILMNSSFQQSVGELHENLDSWKALYQSAGSLVASQVKYSDTREVFIEVLADLNQSDENFPLNKALQQSVLEQTHSKFQSKGWDYSWVLAKAKKAVSGKTTFSTLAQKAIQPAVDNAAARDSKDIAQVFRDDKATQRLFLSGQSLTRTDAQREKIKEQFLAVESPVLPHSPGIELERFLDSILADPGLTPVQQDKTIQALFNLIPPYGDRERFDFDSETLETKKMVADLENLQKILGKRTPDELVGLIKAETTKRLNAPLSKDPMADLYEKSHRLPSTSFFGRNDALRESTAKRMDLHTLDNCLAVFEGLDELETGTSKFLTSSLVNLQKKGLPFDTFLNRYKSIARSERFRGEPELRANLSSILKDGLKDESLENLNKELKAKSVRTVLQVDDRAELLASLVQVDNDGSVDELAEAVQRVESEHKLNDGKPALRKSFRELVAERFEVQPPHLAKVFPQEPNDIERQLSHFNLEVRGLSSLTAVTRQQTPQEQIKMLDYILGRRADMPDFLSRLSKEADSTLGLGKAPTKIATDLRDALDTAEAGVRSMVISSFVSGPQGLLSTSEGKQAIIEKFLLPVSDKRKGLARELAATLLESQDTQAGLSVGYLYSLRGKNGQKLTEGQVLNRLFDSYGTPGIKLKQYLAFTSEFSKFKKDFEASQDSALPLSYLEAVRLAHHHYGEDWRDNWKITGILGSGSVNVAVQIFDSHANETRVLSLPRKDVETNSEYDFYRVNKFVDRLLEDPEKQETFGYLRGLVNTIHDSVSLEFDRLSVYRMSHSVEDFYNRKVGDWQVKTVRVYSLQGKAIEMDQAQGKTARKVLNEDGETYREAMGAIASVERDALFGMAQPNQPTPSTLHANPDFHDGQVLIDKDNKQVTILDFGQAVNIDNAGREYGADLLTIVGGAHNPERAAELLKEHAGVALEPEVLERILDSKDRMDTFTKLLGTLAGRGGKVPIPVVHWVLGMNRQIALAEKTGDSLMNTLRALAVVRKTGGDMATFNALRVARRNPLQAARGAVFGPVGSWVTSWLPWRD